MKRNAKKFISLLLGLCLLFSLAACTEKQETAAQNTGTVTAAQNTGTVTTAQTATFSYPMKTDVTLRIWSANSSLPGKYNDKNNLPFYQGLQKRTGVKIECITPAAGQEAANFNLMVASHDFPDIIHFGWSGYNGGPQKALDDTVIISLNDVIDKYAPNLKKIISSDKDLEKSLKTDSGKFYAFPFIREDAFQQVYRGPIFRKDWLDDLGLKLPVTIDDWYTVLKAFKEKKGATAPLDMSLDYLGQALTQAYKILDTWYYDDSGKLQYGPVQNQYKDYIAMLKKWYSEGLLDKDFSILNQATIDANMLSGKSGATIGNASGGIGKYLDAMNGKDSKYDLAGAMYPVLKAGDTAFWGHFDPKYSSGGNCNAAISTSCKNIEVAARFLDYAYSDEGKLYVNFGDEGISYKMVNGYPTYTDLITKNPEGLPFNQACQIYTGAYGYSAIQDKRFTEQLLSKPQQKEAIQNWMKNDREKHNVFSFAAPTGDEAKEFAKIMNDVTTYKNESVVKFIMGNDSIDNFDKYVEQIKKMGIDKAQQIKQNALDKYNMR